MQLRDITTTACPICGCTEVVAEDVAYSTTGRRRVNQHVNGARWESRHFLCGYAVKYNPNFTREMVAYGCTSDPAIKMRNDLRHNAYVKVLDFIDELEGVDATYVEIMRGAIERTQREFKD